jgi:hypothetical protein
MTVTRIGRNFELLYMVEVGVTILSAASSAAVRMDASADRMMPGTSSNAVSTTDRLGSGGPAMVTEQEVDAMKRGFVGGGVIIAAVLSVAALVVILVGETWAVWPLLPLAAMEVVFLGLWVRRRRRSSGPHRVR